MERTTEPASANLPVTTDTSSSNPTMSQWAEKINEAWQKSVAGIIEVGKLLNQAREELPHGEFGKMFSSERKPGDGSVPFSPRMAQMLMKIAENPVLSDANHGSHLPANWRTLYELTALPPEEARDLIERRAIHPGMIRKDVAKLPSKMVDRVEKGMEALHALQSEYKKSPEWVAEALARYFEMRRESASVVKSKVWRNPSDVPANLSEYLAAIIEALHKHDQKQE